MNSIESSGAYNFKRVILQAPFQTKLIQNEARVSDMGMTDLSSNNVLVEQCISGSEEAWTKFYQQHHGLIEAVVYRYTPASSVETRKDLCQSVYVRLVECLETYDGSLSSLRTFVSMVASRTCIDWIRGQSRMSRAGKNEPISHHGNSEGAEIVLHSDYDPVDEQVAQAESVSLIRFALSRLGQACRELLQLRFFLDLTYERMSVMLGKKENSVNVQVLRCLAQLKTEYDELESEGLIQ